MNVSNGEFLLRGAQVFGQPGELLDTDFTGFSAERALFGRNVTTTLSYFIHNCAPNYYFDENMGECVRCEGLFYNFRQEQCSLCPSGSLIHKIRCINSTGPYNFEISRGFWPSPSLENPLELLWCPVQAACGYYSCRYFGNGINQTKWEISCSNTLENSPCTTGYVDRVCSRCLCEDREGCYFRTSDGYCNKCADVPGRPWLPPLIYIVMTLITILYYALPQTSITTRLTTVLLTYLQLSVPLLEGSVLSTVAALFGIISNAGSSILDIVPALQCSLPVLRSPIGAFLSTMAWPLVVIFPGACFCIVTWNFLYIIYKRKKEKEKTKLRMSNIMESEEWEDNDSTGFSTTTFDACVQAGYYIAFTSYLNWVITILEVWNCTLFDSEFTYMRFNPWIPCSFTDTEYCALFVLSIVFSVLYLIGIPSVLVWTLARKKSMNQYKFERRMGWFTYCYKPKYSNFEFVNM
ncbi:MAG: hypothetical protein Q8L98_05400, partial [Chlamydiales bacterium]|nr:hypothetical protein [Chlamydiales bacterium]